MEVISLLSFNISMISVTIFPMRVPLFLLRLLEILLKVYYLFFATFVRQSRFITINQRFLVTKFHLLDREIDIV